MKKLLGWTLAPDFWASKTTQTAIAATLTATGMFLSHQMTAPQLFFAVLVSLKGAFLRDSLAKLVLETPAEDGN